VRFCHSVIFAFGSTNGQYAARFHCDFPRENLQCYFSKPYSAACMSSASMKPPAWRRHSAA
jgi:hypothetical protein